MKQYLKRFQIFFHILCQASAASLIIYWIYRYGLNNDLCTIEYKTFLNDKGDVYPVLSLCIKNPISDKILLLQNPRVNQSVYIDFLKGEYFDPSFVNIDYKNVTMDMSDYLISDFKKYANGSKSYTNLNPHDKKERISKNTAWILYDDLYNCYSLNVPQNKQMERYGVVLKASIFPNNTRPSNSGFISLIHYPDQLMTSGGTIKYSWPELDRHDKVIMRFKINGVEVLKRRTNGKQLCNPNWEKYDDTVLVKHLSQVGCRAPYQFPSKHFPVCHSQEEMAKAKMDFLSNTFEVNPPCKTIEKLYYTFEESSSPHLDDGQFEVAIYFFDQQFKEILRSRAIDFNTLIGNIGGYIGLFLGYSILQIPDFIARLASKYRKHRNNKQAEPSPIKIDITSSQSSMKNLVLKPNISNEDVVDILQAFIAAQNKLLERIVKSE